MINLCTPWICEVGQSVVRHQPHFIFMYTSIHLQDVAVIQLLLQFDGWKCSPTKLLILGKKCSLITTMTKYYCQSIFKETLGFRLKEEKKREFSGLFLFGNSRIYQYSSKCAEYAFFYPPKGHGYNFQPQQMTLNREFCRVKRPIVQFSHLCNVCDFNKTDSFSGFFLSLFGFKTFSRATLFYKKKLFIYILGQPDHLSPTKFSF